MCLHCKDSEGKLRRHGGWMYCTVVHVLPLAGPHGTKILRHDLLTMIAKCGYDTGFGALGCTEICILCGGRLSSLGKAMPAKPAVHDKRHLAQRYLVASRNNMYSLCTRHSTRVKC